MLKSERQAFILRQINLHNKVLSASLSQNIQVSDDTIRRDLQELADAGKVIKVHGGALSPSFYNSRLAKEEVYAYTQKRIIGQKAAALVKDGMFVLTSGGTTIIEMIKALPPDLHATFISGSIPAVFEYAAHPNIDVIVIGDKLSKSSKITVGAEAIDKIKQLRADLCFMGVNAISITNGITDNDWDVVQVKKAMIEAAQQTVFLSIAEKINTMQPIPVCRLSGIGTLITELTPDDELLKPYAKAGLQII